MALQSHRTLSTRWTEEATNMPNNMAVYICWKWSKIFHVLIAILDHIANLLGSINSPPFKCSERKGLWISFFFFPFLFGCAHIVGRAVNTTVVEWVECTPRAEDESDSTTNIFVVPANGQYFAFVYNSDRMEIAFFMRVVSQWYTA